MKYIKKLFLAKKETSFEKEVRQLAAKMAIGRIDNLMAEVNRLCA